MYFWQITKDEIQVRGLAKKPLSVTAGVAVKKKSSSK